MRSRTLLLSLLVFCSTAVSAETQDVKYEISYRDQIINQAEQFVERTVNVLVSPFISDKDIDCLARNIFYESGGEPLEGKVAVGMVTLNRLQDDRYPKSVCEVVKQRSTVSVPKQVREVKTVKTGLFTTKEVVETKTTWVQKTVYQFSWVGMRNIKIREDDPRWIESREVAHNLARGGYGEWQEKYAEAMNFHAVYVKPGWKLKKIGRVGNHIFYKGIQPVQQGG